MPLPNGERAVVELEKLRDYCLNPRHPHGRAKARAFRSALGYEQRDAETLRQRLLHAALAAEAELREKDEFGQRYMVEFELAGPGGPVTVRSGWIIRRGEDVPRLTTCYVRL